MKNTQVINLVGWCGVLTILVAYAAINFGWLSVHSLAYTSLNIIGSVAILIETFAKRDFQPAVLNSIWAIIALIALVRLI